jgi:YVTN family beta-propeller protein
VSPVEKLCGAARGGNPDLFASTAQKRTAGPYKTMWGQTAAPCSCSVRRGIRYSQSRNAPRGEAMLGTKMLRTLGGVAATLAFSTVPIDAAELRVAYVANLFSGDISVIDIATNAVVGTIPVAGAYEVAFSPDGTRAYLPGTYCDRVVCQDGSETVGKVAVIDTASNSVTALVTVGHFPTGLALTPNGDYVYVVNNSGQSVSVFETATNTVVATIPVGPTPWKVAITSDGSRAYVTHSHPGGV